MSKELMPHAQHAGGREDDKKFDRPESFSLNISGGMLESLGLNMYTSIGKSLSEFVANAFDADATRVDITIPFEEIATARAELRKRAKEDVDAGVRDKFTVLVDPLPGDIQIVIRDNGHGMLPDEIGSKLLVVSRNRRTESEKSESGERYVMGRKGLGKLAGFGTADLVTIRSKRSGTEFATQFTMNYQAIKEEPHLNRSTFDAEYTDELPRQEKGTTVILSGLRCDSLKAAETSVRRSLAQNFAIQGDDFQVYLNDRLIEEPPAEYEFFYPGQDQRDEDGFGIREIEVNEMHSFPIRYLVRFRARESASPTDGESQGRQPERGSLPTAMRGARIYCNGRLAAGPTLLNLHTGMHNFHSQAYMECIVHADDIDRGEVDNIGTNRADLKGDSEIVEVLRAQVTEIMRLALRDHSAYRDQIAEDNVDSDEWSQGLLARLGDLSPRVCSSAKKVLRTVASSHGVGSDLYKEVAPLLLDSMNTGDVLTRLIDLEHDPKSIPVLAHQLLELAKIENADVLKLYRGRRRGIEGLRKLIEKAAGSWKNGRRFENELHDLLKENPWLVRPEFARFLTSDKPLADVAKALDKQLQIDTCAPELPCDETGQISDRHKRPDLVFVMSDPGAHESVVVVELKTPNLPLERKHLAQLEEYMLNIEDWLKSKYRDARVRGCLIGDLDPKPQAAGVRMLQKAITDSGPGTAWEVISLSTLLERAKATHLDAIEAAEANEIYLASELADTPVPRTAEKP